MSICQFGPGCFGCCGDNFKSDEEVVREIRENMNDFGRYEDKEAFMKRPPCFKPSGICGNLGFINGKIGCLVYPKKEQDDMGKGYCDHGFKCKIFKEFKSWSEKKQEEFLNFLEKKNSNFYDYSIGMDNGRFLNEFKSSEESWKALTQKT